MSRSVSRARLLALVPVVGVALLTDALPGGAAVTKTFQGKVDHVSIDNIKVTDAKGKTQSFLLVPKFDQVFHFDGKTTYQMKDLKPGMPVRVYYDTTALGARHADKIVVLDQGRSMKS